MNNDKPLDGQPGSIPYSVQVLGFSKDIVFKFGIVGIMPDLKLKIRCTPDNDVYAAVVSEAPLP